MPASLFAVEGFLVSHNARVSAGQCQDCRQARAPGDAVPCSKWTPFARGPLGLDGAAGAANEDDDKFTYKPDYSAKTYVAAVTQMHEWAKLASDKLGREVAGDEVERWAFSADEVPG